jgi:hypothetical protein
MDERNERAAGSAGRGLRERVRHGPEVGEVGLVLLLLAVGLIPVLGRLVDSGWSQGEIGLGAMLVGFALFQLISEAMRALRERHASRSRSR